jgi:hypothetical protein
MGPLVVQIIKGAVRGSRAIERTALLVPSRDADATGLNQRFLELMRVIYRPTLGAIVKDLNNQVVDVVSR